MLAKAIAKEADASFIGVKSGTILDKVKRYFVSRHCVTSCLSCPVSDQPHSLTDTFICVHSMSERVINWLQLSLVLPKRLLPL